MALHRKNASFRFQVHFFQIITFITQLYFEELTCPLYEPPENGALSCNTVVEDTYCQVQCQSGNDFVFNPPLYYFCQDGVWQFYARPDQEYSTDLPWPDCAGTLGEWFRNSTLAQGCRPVLTLTSSSNSFYYRHECFT